MVSPEDPGGVLGSWLQCDPALAVKAVNRRSLAESLLSLSVALSFQ